MCKIDEITTKWQQKNECRITLSGIAPYFHHGQWMIPLKVVGLNLRNLIPCVPNVLNFGR